MVLLEIVLRHSSVNTYFYGIDGIEIMKNRWLEKLPSMNP